MKRFAAILLTILCLCSAAFAQEADAPLAAPPADSSETLICALAAVDAKAEPDRAMLSFAIEAQGQTVAEAQLQVMEDIRAITELLVAQGVQDTAIWHQGYDVSPNVVYHHTKLTDQKVIESYLVKIELCVRLTDIDLAGVVIDAVMRDCPGCLYELAFESSAAPQAYDDALAQAVQQAMDRAQVIAMGCGMELDHLVSVQELSTLADGQARVQVTYRAK